MARQRPYEDMLRQRREQLPDSEATALLLAELQHVARQCADTPMPPSTLHLEKLIFIASYLYYFDRTRHSFANAIARGTAGLAGVKASEYTADNAFKNGKSAGGRDAKRNRRQH